MSYTKLLNDMTWSFSRLHAWEQCPYAFYLKYIEQRDGESNYYAANGKCMHEVFEAILTNQIPLDECTQCYADKYDLICETTKQSTMDSTYEKCMDYLCTIDGIDLEKYEILGVELKLDFNIDISVKKIELEFKDEAKDELLYWEVTNIKAVKLSTISASVLVYIKRQVLAGTISMFS